MTQRVRSSSIRIAGTRAVKLSWAVHGVVRSKFRTPFSRASCSRLTGKKMAAQIVAKTSEDQAYMYQPFSSRCDVNEVSSPGYEACFSTWSEPSGLPGCSGRGGALACVVAGSRLMPGGVADRRGGRGEDRCMQLGVPEGRRMSRADSSQTKQPGDRASWGDDKGRDAEKAKNRAGNETYFGAVR